MEIPILPPPEAVLLSVVLAPDSVDVFASDVPVSDEEPQPAKAVATIVVARSKLSNFFFINFSS
jgi:hypothetical protein